MDTIKALRNIPIQDVLKRLQVKRSGSNYHCISPTHRDDKASLSVNVKENYFHCFGCGIGGSVIDLYMILYGIGFKEASRRLAEDFNLPFEKTNRHKTKNPTPDQSAEKPNKAVILEKYNFLCKYDNYLFDERSGISGSDEIAFQCVRADRLERNKIIFESLYDYCELTDDVYNYLTEERHLSEDVIRAAKIFSLQNYKDVNNYLKSKFDIEELTGSGLYKDGNLIFKISHRLIIPYLENDQIIYLRARYFDSSGITRTNNLKYFGLRNDDLKLNTVKRLYNTDILSGLKIYDELFICEGELDCLALLRIGINAVAIPGISAIPTNEQLSRLTDYSLTLCFDNDPPGQDTTEKLIETFRNIGKEVKYIGLPDGVKDVSDFIIEKYSIKNKTDSPELTVGL